MVDTACGDMYRSCYSSVRRWRSFAPALCLLNVTSHHGGGMTTHEPLINTDDRPVCGVSREWPHFVQAVSNVLFVCCIRHLLFTDDAPRHCVIFERVLCNWLPCCNDSAPFPVKSTIAPYYLLNVLVTGKFSFFFRYWKWGEIQSQNEEAFYR